MVARSSKAQRAQEKNRGSSRLLQTLFNKLAIYLGNNLVHLVDRPDDPHCFRMQKNKYAGLPVLSPK